MKGIRGRYGQQEVLESESNLSMHLLETKLFSEEVFYSFLATHNYFIIKPIIGAQEVLISVTDAIELKTGDQVLRFSNKEEIYDYLREQVCIKKFYIIQAIPMNPSTLCLCRFTLHRKSPEAVWKIVHSTSVNDNCVQDSLFFKWKLNNFLLNTAKRLGAAYSSCQTIVVEIAKYGAEKFWLTDAVLHERNSKWSQYHSLHQKKSLRPFLPATELCTKQTLLFYLNTYPEVIIKPCVGQQGRGIVKLSITEDMTFEVHEKQNKTFKDDFDQLYKYIYELYLSKKDYIVQQRISLTEINGNPFDVRVITQFDEGKWIVSGTVVKVAAKDYFVSNRASKLLTLENALSKVESDISVERCAKWIETVCKRASKSLCKNNRGLSIIGFDIGIDSKGAVWVIEGNYAPSLSMFYMFGNNEIHEKVSYYIRKHKKSD